jgi:hypothetical protein
MRKVMTRLVVVVCLSAIPAGAQDCADRTVIATVVTPNA